MRRILTYFDLDSLLQSIMRVIDHDFVVRNKTFLDRISLNHHSFETSDDDELIVNLKLRTNDRLEKKETSNPCNNQEKQTHKKQAQDKRCDVLDVRSSKEEHQCDDEDYTGDDSLSERGRELRVHNTTHSKATLPKILLLPTLAEPT